jgi:hypothetical protein
MTRKIDPEEKVRPTEMDDVTHRKGSSRPPHDWPGIPGRSEEDDATFTREGKDEAPADVTESQRELERKLPHDHR